LAAIDLDQNAIMLYTSGTSGQPKGVPLTHRNVGVNGRDWLECNAPILEEGYRDLLWLPMSHIFGYGEAGVGNQLGWVSYMSDPKSVVADLPRVKPNVFFSVPSVLEKLASFAREKDALAEQIKTLHALTGGELRFCLSGGAGLKRAVKELFDAAGLLIIEGYGLTECSPTLTLNRPGDYRFDSVGKALPSVTLKLAEDGEILAKGANVFAGYHKNAAATDEAFKDGWFLTGDIGRLTEDGFLQIVDRKKDILVTAGGKNVAPANIEVRFHDDPAIDHVVVFGDGEKYLVAGVWPSPGVAGKSDVQARVQASVDAVNAGLARYETIKKFVVFEQPLTVEGGHLTPTFKIRRKRIYADHGDALRALYGSA
ncbi:MAG: AMP-binding protein, partial [Myxococcota bacterium]